MAQKKPLVLYNGEPGQIQAGDNIAEVDFNSMVNGEAGTVVIGTPVYVSAADTFKKAKADAAGTMPFIGFIVDTTVATATAGNIQSNGILALTTGQWDAVAGTTGGLAFGTKYYISNATAGLITSTAPTTGYSQRVGIALSTTELQIQTELPSYQL